MDEQQRVIYNELKMSSFSARIHFGTEVYMRKIKKELLLDRDVLRG